MTSETKIMVNVQLHETRIAVLENGKLKDLFVERPDERRLIGNIYKGKVTKILSGIQACFVDVGFKRQVFLHINQISTEDLSVLNKRLAQPLFVWRREEQRNIKDVLKQGQEIIVQITKEQMGTKNPRSTTSISLAGRYIVLIPGAKHIGVSRNIRDRGKRAAFRRLISQKNYKDCGFIVRTIADGQPNENIEKDTENLVASFEDILKKADIYPSPALLHRDMGLNAALVRDYLSPEVDEMLIDSKDDYEKVIAYTREVAPSLANRIRLYKSSKPLFDSFGIEEQIASLLSDEVYLSGGGSIVIEQTEAMVTIDVNTGSFRSRSNYEDTILKINLKAADEIARQLILRDLGGIIAVDFIDMRLVENRQKLFERMQELLEQDKAPTRVLPPNDFGVVMLTRRRVQESVIDRISDRCPVCSGTGRVFSAGTVLGRLERWLMRSRKYSNNEFILMVSPSLARELLADNRLRLHELEESYSVHFELLPDMALAPDEFLVVDAVSTEDITDRFLSKPS